MLTFLPKEGDRYPIAQMYPITSTEPIIPPHLDHSIQMLRDMYKRDIRLFLLQNNLSCNEAVINSIMNNPIAVLGRAKARKYHEFEGEFRTYVKKLRNHLLFQWNRLKNPIFLKVLDKYEITNILREFDRKDVSDILEQTDSNEVIYSSNRFTQVINSWYPEIYGVPIEGRKYSMYQQLYVEDLFYKIIYRIAIKDCYNKSVEKPLHPVSTWLIQEFTRTDGNQIAWNFPVTVAKYIYQNTLPRLAENPDEPIIVADTSLGWGGRLAGLMAAFNLNSELSGRKVKLIGTDPNVAIKDRYQLLIDFWKENVNHEINISFENSTVGAECLFDYELFRRHKGKVHMILTSPPYFNKEHYSDDPGQSYLKFPEYDEWRDGFLKPMLKNAYELLRPNGELWLNIADIKSRSKNKQYPLQADTVKSAIEAGLSLKKTYKMLMTIVQGAIRTDRENKILNKINHEGKTFKYEPIFVLKKEN